jgi:hypothetical protein
VVVSSAPDEGERLIDIEGTSEDSILDAALVETKYPTGNGETAVEFSIDPALFHETFAADLPADQAAVMAATQRPVAAAGFTGQRTAGLEDPALLGSGGPR